MKQDIKQLVRKIPVQYIEYGAKVYIGETKTHFLATVIDYKGVEHSVVYALSKKEWRIYGM